MYDVHCHLIFGEDDGSRSIDESIEMIKIYKDLGYKGAILTSHYDEGRYLVTSEIVLEKLEILKNAIKEKNIDFELFPGNEIQIDLNTMNLLKENKILRLNNSRYILCELPFSTKPIYAKEIFYQMQLEGYIPIIAHPERYEYIRNDIEWFDDFIKTGCLLQMNLSSLTSTSLKDISEKMLARNMIHLVGTDAHQIDWRSPNVINELEVLNNITGKEKFEELTHVNPKKIIDNKFISSNYDNLKKLSENKITKKKRFEFWR
jgi:protein-tyrosine phosphatase